MTNGRDYIAKQISEWSRWTYTGQRWWSFANNGSTTLIVVCSAVAAVVTQTQGDLFTFATNNHIATILSLIVTVVSTIQSKLGFERKWIANRGSQANLRQLEIDERTGLDLHSLGMKLKAIIAAHNQMVTGAGTATSLASPAQTTPPLTALAAQADPVDAETPVVRPHSDG